MKNKTPQTSSEQKTSSQSQKSKASILQQSQADIPKKNHKLLKTFLYFLVASLLLATGALGFWFYHEKIIKRPRSSPAPSIIPPSTTKPEPVIPPNWQTYRNEEFGFEFRYSADTLRLSEEEGGVLLSHSILYEHQDPCEFRDNIAPLKELTDFKVAIQVLNKSLKEAVMAKEGDYLASNFVSETELKLSPNFIDEFSIGSLTGYRITTGVEGCGQYTYYFPLTAKKTLVVNRSFITEFNPIILDYEKYLNLPGIIVPQEEEKLFNQILSSFKF